MSKFFKKLWDHKKKIIFLAVGGYYGLDYLYNRHKSLMMVRALCQEAWEEGRKPIPQMAKNKHITLLLNPASANKKARWRFEKYAESMLHLSGFLVNIVKTERISEARDLTELIERTNVIAVAGGDGTIFEAITGLLRREDADEAARRYPIGLIPIGLRNKFAKRLSGNKYDTYQELIAESAMAIVRHQIKPKDVLQFEIVEPAHQEGDNPVSEEHEAQSTNEKRKPVYSMSGLTLGQFREADHIQVQMPSIFPEKFSAFWSLWKAPKERFKAEIKYTPRCSGCSKCIKEEAHNSASLLSRMTSILRPTRSIPETIIKVENPECGNWKSICVDTLEFNVKPKGDGNLEVEVGVNNGRMEFILEGLRRYDGQEPTLSNKFDCNELEIIPLNSPEYCSIDYEEFEFKPLKVKVLRNKVYFFAP